MSSEDKGSKPGLIERNRLTRVNTFPSVEFSIPPSDPPEQIISRCASHPTRCDAAQAHEKKNEADGIDEEERSVTSDNEVSYPEGGLKAWLVVFGSFMGSVVGFGMM